MTEPTPPRGPGIRAILIVVAIGALLTIAFFEVERMRKAKDAAAVEAEIGRRSQLLLDQQINAAGHRE